MSNHPSGDSEPPSPRDTEAAGSPGGEASAESSTAQTAQGAHGAEQDDDFDSDSVADSAIETDILSTMTAPDEFFAFIEENGRTYHSYKASKYLLPNDVREQERMDLQHLLYLETTHGKLFLAPVRENPRRCLDLMTGTGNWAIDFADAYPMCDVLGTDLSPIQPQYVPVNCRFEVDDAEDQWNFRSRFDLIHARASVLCWRNYAAFVDEAYKALEPGGWLEMQEFNHRPVFHGEVSKRSAIKKYCDLIVQGAQSQGISVTGFGDMKNLMTARGFVNVEEKRFIWPLGTWAKGRHHRNLGILLKQNFLMVVEALALRPLSHLGWSQEEIQVLLAEVRRELQDNSVDGSAEIIYIYGQRPPG